MKKQGNKIVSECSEELVYLYRSGELTEKEQELLHEHLKLCSSCRKISEGLMKYDEAVRCISSENLELNTDALRGAIFAKTVRSEKKEREHKVVYLLFSPQIQYLVASAVVFLVLLFLYQNIMMVHKLTRLEKHLVVSSRVYEPPSAIDLSKALTCLPVLQDGEARIIVQKLSPECRRILREIKRNTLFRESSWPAFLKYQAPDKLRGIIMQSYSKGKMIRLIQ